MYFHIFYDSFGVSNALFLSYNVTLLLRNLASSASKIICRKYKNNFEHLLMKKGGVSNTYLPDRRSYSSSVTGSSHSFEAFSPCISKAKWANQLSAAAPCQCFTFAGM